MSYRIRPLDAVADITAFSCGQPALDEYLRRYASQDIRRDVARVFIASPEDAMTSVCGFYTLRAGSIRCDDLPVAQSRRLPRYPVPIALIGRLAVAKAFQGQGLASILLADACTKVAQASVVLAMAGIVVDAKDKQVAAFYRHFGFAALPGQAQRLWLPAKAYIRHQVDQPS